MDPIATSYDEVPYASTPRRATHPDSLATLARLLGMQPAPVERCRVLELGCGTGGNLLPMAEALPEGRFVGIDLSGRQIELARQLAAAVGLTNLDLRACSILDVDESWGTFDYILCHGVYSWVPAPVREHILEVCRRNLAPHGVAYISYNTYPGWHRREAIRDMMRYHVRDLAEPAQRVAQARALLNFLIEASPAPEGLWARLLNEERALIGGPERDYYLYHEHLADLNQGFYFHEFIAQAGRHGLQYLGETPGSLNVTSLPSQVQEALKAASTDLVQLEQYADFLSNRAFRRTLLVHASHALDRAPAPEIVYDMLASATAQPRDLETARAAEVVEFENDDGVTATIGSPLVKTALLELLDCWPRPLSFTMLWQRVADRLGLDETRVTPDLARAQLAAALVQLYLSGLAGLHVHEAVFTTTPGERPLASPLARWQAEHGLAVANQRHCTVKPSVLDREVLALLDGSRARPALVQALVERVQRGELEMQEHGRPLTDGDTIRAVLTREVDAGLQRLAQSAVLLA